MTDGTCVSGLSIFVKWKWEQDIIMLQDYLGVWYPSSDGTDKYVEYLNKLIVE